MPGSDPQPTTRTEQDALGPIEVPTGAKWQAQTQRAVENFPISGRPVDPDLIAALAAIKATAADVNAELGVVDRGAATAIAAAAAEVRGGAWADQFPVDVFQTGSGTSTNMNMNEVLATLATEATGTTVHPNDQVNASQSSNDVIPSAIRIAAATGIVERLIPALSHLAASLRRQQVRHADTVKLGRTHLMDAVPITLGPGVRRVRHRDGARHGPPARHAAPALRPPARRDGGGDRAQRPRRVRTGGDPPPGPGVAPAPGGGSRPLRGPGSPGRVGGGEWRVPGGGRRPQQGGHRPAVDVLRTGRGAGRDPPSRPPARAARSCRAR